LKAPLRQRTAGKEACFLFPARLESERFEAGGTKDLDLEVGKLGEKLVLRAKGVVQ
jgi:hypothetical protein